MINNFIRGLLSIAVFVYIAHMFFEFKYNHIKLIFASIVAILGKALLPIDTNLHLNLIYSLFTFVILIFLFFKGSLFYKAVFILTYVIGSAVTEMFTMKILSLAFKNLVLTNSIAYWSGIIVSNLLLISISFLAAKYKIYEKNDIPKYSWIILILPITSILLILGIDDYYIITENNSLIFIIIGLFLSNYIIIFIYYKTIKAIINKNKLSKELEESNNRNDYLSKLLKQHTVFLHDIRKQSLDMLALLDKKEYSILNEYIKNVYSETTKIYNMISSNFEIVDILINDRLYIIKNNNINLRIKLECTDFSPLNYMNIETMFNALIDLALSECINSKKEDKTLLIKSKKIGKQCALTASFSSTMQIESNPLYAPLISLLNRFQLEYLVNNLLEIKLVTISILFIGGNPNANT